MPLLLTTSYDPGDSDPGHTYPRAKIVRVTVDTEAKFIEFIFQYGDEVAGAWVRGKSSPDVLHIIQNAPSEPGPATTDYDDMIAEATTVDEDHVIYAGVKRVLYEWLLDKGILSGTIE
jgi:hypothetical protein